MVFNIRLMERYNSVYRITPEIPTFNHEPILSNDMVQNVKNSLFGIFTQFYQAFFELFSRMDHGQFLTIRRVCKYFNYLSTSKQCLALRITLRTGLTSLSDTFARANSDPIVNCLLIDSFEQAQKIKPQDPYSILHRCIGKIHVPYTDFKIAWISLRIVDFHSLCKKEKFAYLYWFTSYEDDERIDDLDNENQKDKILHKSNEFVEIKEYI
jgi:hypothetical protein